MFLCFAVEFFQCYDVSSSRIFHNYEKAAALETGTDFDMKVSRFRLKMVHKVVMWTYVICQSFRFNEFVLAEYWISAPRGFSEAYFQCNFVHCSISLLATYN